MNDTTEKQSEGVGEWEYVSLHSGMLVRLRYRGEGPSFEIQQFHTGEWWPVHPMNQWDVSVGSWIRTIAEDRQQQRRRMVELVAEWRERFTQYDVSDSYGEVYYKTLQRCADQLEALITGDTTNEQ